MTLNGERRRALALLARSPNDRTEMFCCRMAARATTARPHGEANRCISILGSEIFPDFSALLL
jgi:hypothetical protein